ncbi:MAG: MFS transporter [Pseudomonadota bacterium]
MTDTSVTASFKDGLRNWRKLGTLFSLQIAHDLPGALTATMAPTLFVKQFGMPLEYIGLFFIPFIVTALKWTWAPVVDNHSLAGLSHRKSWLAPLTVMVSVSFLLIASVEPSLDTLYVIISLLVVKQVFFATQEIAADAYVVENLAPEERGIGASVVWLGKEFGQVIGFAGLLYVADHYGWSAAFTGVAILFALFNLPALLREEPPRPVQDVMPRAEPLAFFRHRVNWRIVSIVFAMAFTLQMPVAIIGPFLGAKGFTISEIGVILGIAASLGAIISLSIASVVITRLGPKRTAILLIFVAPLASPGFFWIAIHDSISLSVVVGIVLWATICTAPIRMVLYAARIGWTSDHQVGTDMTIQQSVWFLGYAASGALSGLLAGAVGWVGFFIVNIVLTAAALVYFINSHDRVETDVGELRNTLQTSHASEPDTVPTDS